MRLSLTYIIDIKESKTTLHQVKYFHIKTKKYHKPGIHLLPMLYNVHNTIFLSALPQENYGLGIYQ